MKLFWRICCLKAGPGDVPYSLRLLALALLVSSLLGWYQLSFRSPMFDALWQAIFLLGVTVSFTFVVLAMRDNVERFVQTLTALIACGVIIHLTALPLLELQPFLLANNLPIFVSGLLSLISLLIILLINVWTVLVNAHIYRQALNVNRMMALLVTFALIAVNIFLFSQVIR